MSDTQALFTSCTLKKLVLPNRVVMAPMTRSFSPGGVPTDEVAAYYV
jgi:2,4-dienoyl-CoA reductase-like NADH-dependent reductase (Old Yellow Enzyme family)